MSWRTIVVNEHAKLSYQNKHMVFKSNRGVEKIHISEIHSLIIETTDVAITGTLIFKLVEGDVRVIFCDDKHNPMAEVQPYYGCHDSSKRINQQIRWENDTKEKVWTAIIKQKIRNQSILLNNQGLYKESAMLERYVNQIEIFDPTNREGHAAKVYFNALFGTDFSRDDSLEENAFLDYGYSIILSIFNREIVKNGRLTQLGLKHSNYFNPYNLASDLMEPFRIIIDQKVLEISEMNFSKNKHKLLEIFEEKYEYNGKSMYLINIVEHYVKKVFEALDNDNPKEVMEFRISEL